MRYLVYVPEAGITVQAADVVEASSVASAVRQWCIHLYHSNPLRLELVRHHRVFVQSEELHARGGTELTAWIFRVAVSPLDPRIDVLEETPVFVDAPDSVA